MGTGPLRGALLDRATQRWVIATGRPVAFVEHAWLDGPVGAPEAIGDAWIGEHAARVGASLAEDGDGGLLPDFRSCDGPGFDAARLLGEVRDFYESTARWDLEVWSRWSRWAEPGGRVLDALFARRLRQLALPLDPLHTVYGMESRVITFADAEGRHLGTAWQRTLRATGATVFGGFYGVVRLPGAARPSIRVVFPLPNGSATVFLRPDATDGGGLRLASPRGDFGEDGAYLVVRPAGSDRGWARRIPLPERFEVFVDASGVVRCDHQLRLHGAEVLRLHYRLQRRASAGVSGGPTGQR
ncbi:hypothetical protein [Egicoccus sp. AB-alg6-2]|uniref:hypothetical protein n=1 Tax=Egicoccus sp. AB-alg6-2 TaxID=3242692 RepID=UPI00359E60A3